MNRVRGEFVSKPNFTKTVPPGLAGDLEGRGKRWDSKSFKSILRASRRLMTRARQEPTSPRTRRRKNFASSPKKALPAGRQQPGRSRHLAPRRAATRSSTRVVDFPARQGWSAGPRSLPSSMTRTRSANIAPLLHYGGRRQSATNPAPCGS